MDFRKKIKVNYLLIILDLLQDLFWFFQYGLKVYGKYIVLIE